MSLVSLLLLRDVSSKAGLSRYDIFEESQKALKEGLRARARL